MADWIEAAAKEIGSAHLNSALEPTKYSYPTDKMIADIILRHAPPQPEWRELYDKQCEVRAGPHFVLPSAEPQPVQEELNPETMQIAKKAVEAVERREGHTDIEQWAKRLADDVTAPRPFPQPVDLDALQNLYDASTPGEWSAHEEPPGCSVAAWLERNNDELASFQVDGDIHDARFCAASHNATPHLLAQARELRAYQADSGDRFVAVVRQRDHAEQQLAASQEREKRLRILLHDEWKQPGDDDEEIDAAIDAALAKE